ncbi:polysaccharide synthesis [Photobacterium sanctipauli]|uniref:Polysaccharide synthesis n=1 Tax=Photobacterium sanctipauli TaxID=1342794 RepID=A0A2T3NT95_9GAMM|nr:capsule biosynthesis GfcC family protein [Photobacterium sanctipauli]PSW19500.1 polysaccharide synthesis [Photobacterium sanctipauli]
MTKSKAFSMPRVRFFAALLAIFAPVAFANTVASSTDSESVTVMVSTSKAYTTQLKRQLQLRYPAPVRIEQVLADSFANSALLLEKGQTSNDVGSNAKSKVEAIQSNDIYWLGAGLYTGFPHPDKALVINQLEQLALQSNNNDKAIYIALSQALTQLTIGERIFTPLDYDVVRITPSANPLVNQDVSLVLPKRPQSVYVLGAVAKPGDIPWQTRLNADGYIAHTQPSSLGDNSVATVIQPDGTVESHSIAYWNQNHQDIAPGAIVYLGFSSLPSGYRSLNDEIINILRNRAL